MTARLWAFLLISILVIVVTSNSDMTGTGQKLALTNKPSNNIMPTTAGLAFAEKDENSTKSSSGYEDTSSEHNSGTEEVKNENQTQANNLQINEENKTEYENQQENENKTLAELPEENETETSAIENETEAGHQGEHQEESAAEIENDNNNEKATHYETEQESSDIEDAKTNETIAAQVDIGAGNISKKSIDSNVTVQIENSTNDAVNITVSATNQTGPKVILIDLNSTTIDVSNIKYLHVTYDGNSIEPATNIDQILHGTSSDKPRYAILITQSGAQILVLIPHFSPHTITLSSISKVIPPVPEFPFAIPVFLASIISLILFYRIKFR